MPLCEFIYTGRRYDPETQLYFYRARYHSPTLGRFISKDPIGYVAGSMGLYESVGPATCLPAESFPMNRVAVEKS